MRASDRAGVGGVLFEFAPANGNGMSAACACTTVTGSKGESLGFTRTSAAYCTKGAINTGIAVGDMVQCSTGQPRVGSGDGSATLGLLMENFTTNVAIRSEEAENAVWTAIAAVTANTDTSPANTATADTLTDSSAAVVQTICQTITTSSLTADAFGIFVKAGTVTGATVTMTGTGNSLGNCSATVTGLSSTTWTRAQCGSAAAYAAGLTAVTVCVGVGSTVAEQGTIKVWGAQMEQVSASSGSALTSYIPTTTVGVVRQAEVTALAPGIISPVASRGSAAATYVLQSVAGIGPNTTGAGLVGGGSATRLLYLNTANSVRVYDETNEIIRAQTVTQFVARRASSSWTGATLTSFDATGGTNTSGAFDGTMNTTAFTIGLVPGIGTVSGYIKLVCVDNTTTGCQ